MKVAVFLRSDFLRGTFSPHMVHEISISNTQTNIIDWSVFFLGVVRFQLSICTLLVEHIVSNVLKRVKFGIFIKKLQKKSGFRIER